MKMMISDDVNSTAKKPYQSEGGSLRLLFVMKLRAAFTDKAWSEGVIRTSYNVV